MADGAPILVDGEYRSEDACRAFFAHQKLHDHQRQAMEWIEGSYVVDIGCYTGFFVVEAQRRHPEKTILGIDYFRDNIRLARLLRPEFGDRFCEMSAYKLDFADDSVDCFTIQDVIEHLEGAAVAVKEMNRALKPGGCVVVTTPNPFHWRQMLTFFQFEARNMLYRVLGKRARMATQIYYGNVEWNRHIYCWTPDTLLTLFVVNGFAYVDHGYDRGAGFFERLLLRLVPFLGGVQILKVRKVSRAPVAIT